VALFRRGGRETFVKVHGLKELVTELNRTDRTLVKYLREANADVARWIIPKAQANARGLGPAAAKLLAPTLKAKPDRYAAMVRMGGARPKYFRGAAGWEYGDKAEPEFPKPFISVKSQGPLAGRALGKAVVQNRGKVEEMMVEGVLRMWDHLAADVNRSATVSKSGFD